MPGIDSLAGDVVSGGINLYEYLHTQKQLKDLEKQPQPEESISPELQNAYSQSLDLSKGGYTAAEKTAFQGNQNRASNTNYVRATRLGGLNLANSIQGSINSDDVQNYDKFAAQDAELHRQNIANLEGQADKIQTQKNAIQDERIKHRYDLETALGNSNKANLEGIMKSFSLGGSLLSGKTETTPTETTPTS